MKLQNKFLGLLVPAGLLAAALVLVLIRRAVHAVIVGGVERSSAVLARAAAFDAAQGLLARSERELLPALQTLQSREGALSASAVAPDGVIVAHTTVTEKGKADRDENVRAALRGVLSMRQSAERGERVLVVAVPVWAPEAAQSETFLLSGEPHPGERKILGALKVTVPLTAALETDDRIIREVSMIVLGIGAITFVLIAGLVRGMLAPIRGLMAGIARIGGGRFDVEVPVLSRDELGDLAASFNAMSGELARTTVSRDYVEGILENMNDLLVVADPEGRIRRVNRAASALLGDGELIGKPLSSIFDAPPDAEVVRDIEVVLRTRGGGRTPALYSSSVLRDRDGRPRGYIGVAKDIAERKRAEEALLTAKIAAETSNRELEAFSYSVAHDLRAPLRSLDGFSQLLLDEYFDKLDDAGKDYLRRVSAGSKKMGRLIDDLLNLSRITRSVLRLETVDLSALARDIGAELSAGERGRRVVFVVAAGLTARGDAALLRLALVNLLGNAWKYTSKHPAARIEFGAEDLAGLRAYFVRDDGAGFDMEFSKRLFQPFSRLHGTAEFEGTGIGLAIVQRVIARHEGRVWGEGAVERGATFHFTLWEGKP